MKSKVLLFALAATALTLTSKAQDKTTFGVRAGVNFTNINGEIGGHDTEYKLKPGFNIGVNAEIPVASEFYLQPGLLFTTKGAKADEGDAKTTVSYLEIPINFLYKPALGPGKMLLGFGPYVGIGLGGKIKGGGADIDVKFKNDITLAEYSDLKTEYGKRLDFGGNLLVGYELSNNLSFQLNAQLGMANLVPKVDGKKLPDTKTKNTGFGISVGYRF